MKETTLKKKIQRIRKKLRLIGVLPNYGVELTEEQQGIEIKKNTLKYTRSLQNS